MSASIRLVLSILGAVLLLVPASGPPARAAGQGNQGLQGGWAVDDAGNVRFLHSTSTQVSTMREAGAGWVRIDFRLGACFADWTSAGCNGRSALETYEAVVRTAADNNLRIVGLLSHESWHGGQAQWSTNNAENDPAGNGKNPYIRAFAQNAVGEVVRRFTPAVTHWEIWNEPNAWTALDAAVNPTGGTFLYPSNFAQLLKRSRKTIRQSSSGGILIAGAIFSHDPGGYSVSAVESGVRRTAIKQGTLRGTRLDPASRRSEYGTAAVSCETVPSGADYLCATYEMGKTKARWDAYRSANGTYPLDHVGQNLYLDQGGPTSSRKLTAHLDELRRAYARHEGDQTAKKTWVQEVGWPSSPRTGGVTPDVQARNLRTAFDTFRSIGYIGRAFWFHVQDVPEAQPSLFHGLVDGGGVKKPVFGAYQASAGY